MSWLDKYRETPPPREYSWLEKYREEPTIGTNPKGANNEDGLIPRKTRAQVEEELRKRLAIPGAVPTEGLTPEKMYGRDSGVLGDTLHNTIDPLGRAMVRGQVGIAKSGLGLVQAVEEVGPALAQGALDLKQAFDLRTDPDLDPETEYPQIESHLSKPLTQAKEIVQRVEKATEREDKRGFRQRVAHNPVGTLTEGLAETLPSLAAYVGLGVAAPELVPVALFGQEAGGTYADVRDQGGSPLEAGATSAVTGSVNAALGTLQVGRVLEGLGPVAAPLSERLTYLLKTSLLGAGTAEAQALTRQVGTAIATAEEDGRLEAAQEAVKQGMDVDQILEVMVPGFLASAVTAGGIGGETGGRPVEASPIDTPPIDTPLVETPQPVIDTPPVEQLDLTAVDTPYAADANPLDQTLSLEAPVETTRTPVLRALVSERVSDPSDPRPPSSAPDILDLDEAPVVQHARRQKGGVESGEESPVGVPPSPPDWLINPPESPEGNKLVLRFAKDREGKKTGPRQIIDHLARAVDVEVRVGKTQLGKGAAHYNREWHGVRTPTRNSMSLMSHEIGHGIENLLVENGVEVTPQQLGLLQLTQLPDSLASAETTREGFAEWVRRYVTDPASVHDIPATPIIEQRLAESAPQLLTALRDSARAWEHHRSRTVANQFRAHNSPSPDAGPFAPRLRDAKDSLLFGVGSRRVGVHRMENQVYRAAKSDVRQELGNRTGLGGVVDRVKADWIGGNRAREEYVKAQDTDRNVETTYQSVLHIPDEVEHALRGTPDSRGIRVRGEDGNFETLFPISFEDIKYGVGKGQWEDFNNYGNARASLSRALKGQEYPGYGNGITVEGLRETVRDYESLHPDWAERFKEVQGYTESLLEVARKGGIKSEEEIEVMKSAYEDYWPLYRVQEEGDNTHAAGTGSKDTIDALNQGARGSQSRIDTIDNNIEKQTQDVMRAYYWNRAVLAPLKFAEQVRSSETASPTMKYMASRIATRLDPKLEGVKKVAQLRPDEIQRVVAESNNLQAWKDVTGQELSTEEMKGIDPRKFEETTGSPKLSAGDVGIWGGPTDIYRQKSPKDTAINVIAAKENGETILVQINDPLLYDLNTKTRDPGEVMEWYAKVVGKPIRPWKRALTQNIAFALRNLPRDLAMSGFMNSHNPEALLPSLYAVSSFTNWVTGKGGAGGGRVDGELMSRSIDQHRWSPNASLGERLGMVLKEGIVPEGYSEMSTPEKIGEIPGQIMSTLLKPVDVFNYVTGQRKVAEISERATRGGAYLKAKQLGASDERAQLAHDQVSGNFGESPGQAGLSAYYRSLGFFNPGVQSSYEALRTLFHPNPRIRLAATSRLLVQATAVSGAWALSRLLMSDEEKEQVKERPETDRQNSMYFAGGVKIPFGYGVEGLVARYVTQKLDEEIGDSPEADLFTASQVLRQITAIPGGVMDGIPPSVRNYVEYKTGYDFFRDKEFEPGWMERLPIEERRYPTTPTLYTEASKKTGVSPLRVQKVVRGGIAPAYDEAAKAYDLLTDKRDLEGNADLPFVGPIFERNPTALNSYSADKVQELAKPYEEANRKWDALDETERESAYGKQIKSQLDQSKPYHTTLLTLKRMFKRARRERDKGTDEGKVRARQIEKEMTKVSQRALLAIRRGEEPDLDYELEEE